MRWQRHRDGSQAVVGQGLPGPSELQGTRKGGCFCRDLRARTVLRAPPSVTSGLRNRERLPFCGFSHPFCGTRLWQPSFHPSPVFGTWSQSLGHKWRFLNMSSCSWPSSCPFSSPRSTSKTLRGKNLRMHIFFIFFYFLFFS